MGHSLGAQLVLQACALLCEGEGPFPARLTLLDPYFSRGQKQCPPLPFPLLLLPPLRHGLSYRY